MNQDHRPGPDPDRILVAELTGTARHHAGGLTRLGFIANLISEPVLKGFIVGLALTIIVGQVPKLLGVSKGEGTSSISCST